LFLIIFCSLRIFLRIKKTKKTSPAQPDPQPKKNDNEFKHYAGLNYQGGSQNNPLNLEAEREKLKNIFPGQKPFSPEKFSFKEIEKSFPKQNEDKINMLNLFV
jgi:hypothetical protein